MQFINHNFPIFMEDSPIATRLRTLIEALGLSDSQFADSCSISRPTLSLLLSGKNKKISDVLLSQIHQAYPQVNIMWILFGEGEVFENKDKASEKEKIGDENQKFSNKVQNDEEQLNLVNVKQLENIIQTVVNKSVEQSFRNMEDLILKIEEPRTFRKVDKITVYYDDSTFDSFIPEK